MSARVLESFSIPPAHASTSCLTQGSACFGWGRPHLVAQAIVRSAALEPNATIDVHSPNAPISSTARATPAHDQFAGHGRVRWIGAAGEQVEVHGERYHLSFCYLDVSEHPSGNPASINLALALGARGQPAEARRHQFSPYADLSTGERRGYLDWHHGERRANDVPRGFLMLFSRSVEQAIVYDQRTADIGAARAELIRLTEQHANDTVFVSGAQRLIEACEFLDSSFIPGVCASAAVNHRAEMPFRHRLMLGRTLQRDGRLGADEALQFYLQQPETHLDLEVAQYFRELHEVWCVRYPAAEPPEFAKHATLPRLTLTYDSVAGDCTRVITSDLPDLGALPVPASLEVLFRECTRSITQFKDQPVGRLIPNMPTFGWAVERRAEEDLKLQPAGAEFLSALSPKDITTVRVDELLELLFDIAPGKPKNLLHAKTLKQLTRTLDEHGVGFEPDPRFGLPKCLRPSAGIALFRADMTFCDEPDDAYFLAQTAVGISAIGQARFSGLAPLQLQSIEERMPYRHRFSDKELQRLEATAAAIAELLDVRKFLEAWLTLIHRDKRRYDVVRGFEIAFKGQRRNGQLSRIATALSAASPMHFDIEELLQATSASRFDSEPAHESLAVRVLTLQQPQGMAEDETVSQTRSSTSPLASLIGLEPSLAELLLALYDRSRTCAEFEELARNRRLMVPVAVERLNEFGFTRFGANAVEQGDGLAISRQAADYLTGRANNA